MCIFEKIFFDNISPIIGSSNHKGIVFLFFVFVSLDENQSSQYSFSRKEEVCFHFFLQFETFFVKISLLFGAFLPCMYVCIFVESIFLMFCLQSLRPYLFSFQPPEVPEKSMKLHKVIVSYLNSQSIEMKTIGFKFHIFVQNEIFFKQFTIYLFSSRL